MDEKDRNFFARLTKLFSTGVIARHKGGKKLKVADLDSRQIISTNATRDRFQRIYSGGAMGGSSAGSYALNMAYQAQRVMLFRDYDTMDGSDPLVTSALNIYAQESTVKNEYGKVLTVECENDDIKEILLNLYYDILNVEFNLRLWVRGLCKYGDYFLFLEISPEFGVVNAIPMSVYDTVRMEQTDPDNPNYVYFETMGMMGQKQKLEYWEVAHFRLLQDSNFAPYGKSQLEGGRRIFRQLMLMEEAMMVHRIMRAPEKRAYYIDVGNLPPGEIDTHMQNVISLVKKVPFINPETGTYNTNYNIQNLMEDLYIPVRDQASSTRVENIGGLEWNGTEDIEYIKNKLLAAFQIPKSFLQMEENVSGKLTLASMDVRFARAIEDIQGFVENELYRIGILHLWSQGFRDEDLITFKVNLTKSSTIYEQEKINLWKERMVAIRDATETKLVSSDTVYEHILNMSETERDIEKERVADDVKRMYRLAQIEQGAPDPKKFGFPQDRPAPPPMETDPNGGGGTAPPLGEDVAPGRPQTGINYGQDDHPSGGRDPLGTRKRYDVIVGTGRRTEKKKFPLSMEAIKTMVKNMPSISNKGSKSIILEQSMLRNEETIARTIPNYGQEKQNKEKDEDAGTYMDEKNIEND